MNGGRDQELDGEPAEQSAGALSTLVDARTPVLSQLDSLLDDLLFRLDDSGEISFAGGAVESVLGYDPADLVGDPFESVVADAEILPHQQDQPADEVAVSLRTLGGRTRPVTLSWRSLPDGTLCLARDVSEQRQIERTLDQYRELVGAVADPMYVLDEDGTIERINDAMVEYTGYDREELVGRLISEIIPTREYDRATEHLEEVSDADQRRSATFETTLITNEGEAVLTEAKVTSLTDQHGEFAGSVGALRDIRERKQRERDLDMLKGVLTRVFRHNVRNELSVVLGHADLLSAQVDEEYSQFAEKIMERSNQLLDHTEKARLLEQVIETDERFETDLAVVAEKVTETIESEFPDAAVETAVPPETIVEAHPKIESAVEELIDNAIRHAPDEEPWVKIWADQTEEYLTLFVEDESGGLDEHEIEVLREGTESDLEHGSGVGLWLVRSVVEHSNADMIAHRTDEGSLMGIRFPRLDVGTGATEQVEDSPFARVPAHIQEEISPERFHGEIVIGRMKELHELEDTYDALARTGGHAVLITGETGVGKSTLVDQFRERVSENEDVPLIAAGGCEPERTQPYHVFRRAMAELPVGTRVQELLEDAAAFGADDPQAVQHRKQALFADIADQLRELALDHTVVFVVEDLQWADPGTIDLLEFLIEEVGRWAPPILFVGTYRIEDVGRAHPVLDIADQMTDAGRGTVLELEPFEPDDVESLLGYILDIESVPDTFVEAVYDHTGGTPLFVAELGRHLAETLGPSPAPTELPDDLTDVAVPATVDSAVTERLTELAGPVTTVLQTGAVIGESVSFDVLREASERPEPELVECVDNLVQRRLWDRSGGTLRFVHGLLREQVLDTIADDELATRHTRVAHAIEAVRAVEDHYGRLAHHYDQAGDHEQALEYYQQAGDQAAEAYAHETAIDHYKRAMTLARECGTDQTWMDAGERLAEIYLAAGEYDECMASLRTVREKTQDGQAQRKQRLARIAALVATRRGEYDTAQEEVQAALALDDAPTMERCRLLDVAVRFQQEQGRYDDATETAERQIDLAADLNAPELRAKAIRYLGIIAWREGEFEQAREYTRECLSIGEQQDDEQIQAKSLHFLGVTAWGTGEYEQAREYYERSRALKQEIGDHHGEAKTLNNLGLVVQEQGDYQQAREYYEACLETYRNLGDRHGEAKTLNNLGIVARIQGNYQQAREYYERCLDIERDIGDQQGETKALTNLGEIARQQGRYERARAHLEESLNIARDLGDQRNPAETRMHLGFVEARQGNVDRAREQFEASLDIARDLDIPNQERHSLRGLAALARRQGELSQADEYLDTALEEESGDPLTVAELHLEAGRVALAESDTDGARRHAQQAHETFTELGATHWIGRSRALQGQIAASDGSEAAVAHWRGALDCFGDVGAPQDTLSTLDALVEYCREQGETETAREWCREARSTLAAAPDVVARQHSHWVETRSDELGLS